MIDAVLTNSLLPLLSRELLTRRLEGVAIEAAHVGVVDGQFQVTLKP
jgi:type VI secretion system protein VasG